MDLATSFNLLQGGTAATGPGACVMAPVNKALQATVIGTGAVAASVDFEGSILGDGWVLIGSVTLAGTGLATDGFVSTAPWPLVRANVRSVSAGATVNAAMGA